MILALRSANIGKRGFVFLTEEAFHDSTVIFLRVMFSFCEVAYLLVIQRGQIMFSLKVVE